MPTVSFMSATAKSRRMKESGKVVSTLAAVWVVYCGALHPWFMNWGATAAEQRMTLPGDDLLPNAAPRFTRAITIRAPASTVWRWIVQIGQDRAGFYSNTWLENLSGAGIHNAEVIHPEWQNRTIGDRVLLARPDLLGGSFAKIAQTRIVALEPERLIADIPNRFVLQPLGPGTTRLLLREAVPSTFAARATNALLWDPIHFVMEQRGVGADRLEPGRRWSCGSLSGAAPPGAMGAASDPAGASHPDFDRRLERRHGRFSCGRHHALALGRRWWPPYLLLATAVALILLVAPDPYTVFGIALGAASLAALGPYFTRRGSSRPARFLR